jgi:hypothetical protein
MQQQPSYQVEPASRTIPAHSTRRQVRFFLLCVLNALVLISIDPFNIIRPAQQYMLFGFIEQYIVSYSPVASIINIGLLTICLACPITTILDSFALFLPAPRLQRWTTSSYLVIGALISLIALAVVYCALAPDTPCPVEPTVPPCVDQVIGARPGQHQGGGWLGL